jgi:2-keto-3-deoxy-galactonokinase
MSCQVSTAIRTPQALRWLTGQAVGAEEDAALFVGVDWGGRHHDVCVLDQDGVVLAARRIADGLAGATELHALVAGHAGWDGRAGRLDGSIPAVSGTAQPAGSAARLDRA